MKFDLEPQVAWLDQIVAYRPEYEAIPELPTGDPATYYWRNNFFTTVDGEMLHAMLRILRPSRLVEVGSGHSTRCAHGALTLNAQEGYPCEHTAIDPNPRASLPDGVWHIAKRVQDVSMKEFTDLQSGDVLFIDSEHRSKPGGAVGHIYWEVLPALASGVVVHVHDIFLPSDYPARWDNRHYDEQWVLERLLATGRWEILAGASFLHTEGRLRGLFASYTENDWPSSFWMRKR